MKTPILKALFAAILAALVGISAQAQTVFVSNLDQASSWTTVGWVGGNSILFQAAGSFTTSAASLDIGSVSLAMRDANGTTSATFSVRLFSDAAGLPGASLATFSGESNPSTEGIYAYTLASPYTVATNTTYWIVASAPGQASNFDYFRWKDVDSNTSTSDYGWSLGFQSAGSNDGGLNFEASGNEAVFAVGAAAIPEPSTYAVLAGLAALGLAAWRRRGAGGTKHLSSPSVGLRPDRNVPPRTLLIVVKSTCLAFGVGLGCLLLGGCATENTVSVGPAHAATAFGSVEILFEKPARPHKIIGSTSTESYYGTQAMYVELQKSAAKIGGHAIICNPVQNVTGTSGGANYKSIQATVIRWE